VLFAGLLVLVNASHRTAPSSARAAPQVTTPARQPDATPEQPAAPHLEEATALATPHSSVPTEAPKTTASAPVTVRRLLVMPRASSRRINIVVAGVTPQYTRGGARLPESFRGLTDTVMLVQVDANAKTVRVLSFPRDTKVIRAGGAVSKLNAVLPTSGPAGLDTVVSRLTGLPVHAHVLIGLEVTRELTDALGGVDVFVPTDMWYEDKAARLSIRLRRGQQRLNGADAEGFVRFRSDSLGDVGRVQRQQTFLRAVLERLASPSGLTRLPVLNGVVARNTRSNIQDDQVAAVLDVLRHRPRFESFTLPGTFDQARGASYWAVNDRDVRALVHRHFREDVTASEAQVSAGAVAVAVVDAGGGALATGRVRDALRAGGYVRARVAKAPGGDPARTVILGQTSVSALDEIRSLVGVGEARVSGEGVVGADVTIWVGADARN